MNAAESLMSLTVTTITDAITDLLDECIGEVELSAEAENCSRSVSTPVFVYVALTDNGRNRIYARGKYPTDLPLPSPGQKVRLVGKFVFYPPKGNLQFHFSHMELA
jgi:exonuclease VII large subunit